jgi:hypothetical protein
MYPSDIFISLDDGGKYFGMPFPLLKNLDSFISFIVGLKLGSLTKIFLIKFLALSVMF